MISFVAVVASVSSILLQAAATETIVDTAIADGRFTVLVEALQAADLVGALSGTGPFTVFAPTDAAFTTLLDTLGVSKTDLLARADLADILKYHVIAASKVISSDLAATQDVTTLEGNKLTVTKNGNVVMAGTATVSGADVECSNGVIHVIDAVLLPPQPDIVATAIADSRFTVLVEALQTAGLVDALKATGPFTVFAPTNAAFTVLLDTLGVSKADLLARADLADILKYHVIATSKVMSSGLAATQDVTTLEGNKLTVTKNGNVVMAGTATVSGADVECSNGVIHVIDAVLLPPQPDIVATAIADSRFTVLVEALQTAGLVDALKATGPFTVFAPTNAAFTALLTTLSVSKADLLARADLADILKYHVTAAGKVMSSDLAATQDVTTLEGNKLTVTKNGNVVMAGTAKVSGADVECSNGVIHVIDAVLLPPSATSPENMVSNSWCNRLSFSTVLFSGFFALTLQY